MTDLVEKTIAKLERFIATVDDALALPREAAQFARALILSTGAKRAVEIGTSYGYSGLWMASALVENGGKLITIDHDARKLQVARSYFETAGLAEHVECVQESAVDALATLDGPVDFVLNDADKENCRRYLELLADKLSDRAIVLTDNTTSHPDQLAEVVSWLRGRSDFFSTHVPIGNGMELSVKWTSSKRSRGVFGM